MKYAVIGLSILVLAVIGLSDSGSSSARFSDLSQRDRERLAGQRHLVLREAERRYGTARLFGDARDLVVLQRLLDDRAFGPEQTHELQSLGVVFGDIFDALPEFHWAMVTDDYGRDPTLRYKATPVHLNALTMISKRVERGDEVDLNTLYAETYDSLSTLKDLKPAAN